MNTELTKEILEVTTYLASTLQTNGYKNLAGTIRSNISKYNKKYKNSNGNEESLAAARKLLTSSFKSTYNFFKVEEELLNVPLSFFKELELEDVVFFDEEDQEVSYKGLKENQLAVEDLKETIHWAFINGYLDEGSLKGWFLFE